MAQTVTLLAQLNSVLTQSSVIQSDLTTFTDSAYQVPIDQGLQTINDIIDELFQRCRLTKPQAAASSTFVLAQDDNEYALASDFEVMDINPIDTTNINTLFPYPGGFQQMVADIIDVTDFTGRPRFWAINTTNGQLRIDAMPTSSEVGETYTYYYKKEINLTGTTDTFPFSDETTRALNDAMVQTMNRKMKTDFDQGIFETSMARAAKFLRNQPARRGYARRAAA